MIGDCYCASHSLRMYFLCWNCDCSSATRRCEGQRVSFRLKQKMCDARASIGTPAASYLLTIPPYEQCGVKCLIAAFVCLGILHGGLHVPAASYSSLGVVSPSPYFATCRLCHRKRLCCAQHDSSATQLAAAVAACPAGSLCLEFSRNCVCPGAEVARL